MKYLLAIGWLCFALEASALTINFSGEITTATAGSYHFDVGDVFTGVLSYDETIPNAPLSQQFLGASISVPGAPTISFPNFLMSSIVISPTRITVGGNPTDFRGGFTLFMEDGVVTGGTISLNDEEFRNNGDFTGIIYPASQPTQSVPEHANAFVLLLLGSVAGVGMRLHGINASSLQPAKATRRTSGRALP